MNKFRDRNKLIVRFMRCSTLTILCILTTFQLCLSVESRAQKVLERKVTLSTEGQKLQVVLEQISNQTNAGFVYSSKFNISDISVSVQIDNRELKEALEMILDPNRLDYELVGSNIVIKKKSNAEISAMQRAGLSPAGSLQKSVSGTVVDAAGLALPGVSVKVKGTDKGVSTGIEGQFRIANVEDNAILVFSYVGFLSQEVSVAGKSVLNVILQDDVKALDEVLVNVGYGSQKRANVLGAINQVKTQEIEDFPVANLTSALKNSTTLQGVSVGITSGKPGANTSINIRNNVTFSANGNTNPLFVIDGFQQTMEDFENIDASMVETITVLKDAAASIYGSKGANGVVLVTTKKGREGKARISYSLTGGITDATMIPDMLTSYDHGLLLNRINSSRNRAPEVLYTDNELRYLQSHDYDWLGEVWQTSGLQRHAINVSGGTEKVSYFAGGNFYKETGNLRDLDIMKYGLRFGMNAQVIEGLTASVSLSTDNSEKNNPRSKSVTSQAETMSETFSALLVMPRWTPMYINGLPVYDTNTKWHPYELQNSGSYARSKSQGVTLSSSLSYKVPQIKGLSLQINYGRNIRNNSGKEYYSSYDTYEFRRLGDHTNSYSSNVMFTNQINQKRVITNGNFLSQSYSSAANYQLNESINYTNTFGKHNVSVLVGAEQSESSGEGFDTRRTGQVIDGFDQFWGFSLDKTQWDNSGTSSEGGRMSYLSRLNYSFNEKYLLEATFRADASPNFPKEGRWGYFPSVALGWRLSDEPFFKDNIGFLSEFKVRAQIGLTGNDNTANYQYKERYTQSSSGGILFGDVLSTGLDDGVAPNPHITWEKALYKNLGFDGSSSNQRWNFSVDLYHRRSFDMLETPTSVLPTTYGNTVSDQNHGEVKTWGLEYRVAYSGKIGNDFRYTIVPGIGGSWMSDNKVIKRYIEESKIGTWEDPNGRRTSGSIDGYRFVKMIRTQEDLDAWKQAYPGYTLSGSEVQLGNLVYEDINGDGKITDLDIVRLIDRPANRFSAGINFQPSYKSFKMQFGLSASFGGYKVFEKDARTAPNSVRTGLTFWEDSWSDSNPNATYPAIDDPLAKEQSSFWIKKNKCTISLGNVQASYALPKTVTSRLKMQQLRVFASVTNLWDFGDPLNYKYSGSNKAFDYPAMRTLAFGLNLDL